MARVVVTALVVGLVVGGGARAGAKEKDLQYSEFEGALDLNIITGGNEALFSGHYIFTPAGIDRNDEIPPILRRFLLHPAALFADISHNGGTRESITTFEIGGEIFPL